ncbi:S8 family serine peptidase [Veronia pacifica]|uniref:Alkaline serine protease n=1 Tax=Veronia pacifica TaxID=1080227 RepID=A0A1C3EPH3_9GAMM|nr:S8 family serine peptidase [Veronia pacifica]ODA35102.1 alkaline serine protease [Veronia pacifica]
MKTSMIKPAAYAGAFALSLLASSIQAETQQSPGTEPQRFIVQLNDTHFSALTAQNVSPEALELAKIELLNQTALTVDAEVIRSLPSVNAMALMLDADQKAALDANPNVAFVEVDPKRYLMAESEPYGIGMVQADQVSDSMSGNRKVCIMDTGYERGHEDLPNTGITGDDGYGSNDTGNWFQDGNGHGTHVAGTIAGLGGNNRGVVGVNPSGLLGLHIVKVFDDSGSWAYGSDLVAAVNQCVNAGSNVISMSLGGGGSSNAERQAFANAKSRGVLSIAAAGNDGNSTKSYPASYNDVVSVAAVDSSGNKASFSQYNDQVEIAAPGVGVNSTYINGGYRALSGTSMATPHVSGVAALIWSYYPSCSADKVRQAMNETAQDRGAAGRDNQFGYGIVKAKDALTKLGLLCEGDIDQKPVAKFTATVNGKSVSFVNESTDDKGITAFMWKFGDGNTSTQETPRHTYASDGKYTIELTVTDTKGQKGSTSNVVNIGGPVDPTCAAPWSAATSYKVDDEVSYKGYKYKATWWSTGAQPDVYTNVWKKLSVCNGSGGSAPIADFGVTASDLTVTLTDKSTDDKGVVSYDWSFGDGGVSVQKNPVYTYQKSGTYTIRLSVKDAEGKTGVKTKSVTVTVGGNTGGCNGVSAWQSGAIYLTGDTVSYNGSKFSARWWTQGEEPGTTGQWGVWKSEGSCQ